jgi:hypothetical protein
VCQGDLLSVDIVLICAYALSTVFTKSSLPPSLLMVDQMENPDAQVHVDSEPYFPPNETDLNFMRWQADVPIGCPFSDTVSYLLKELCDYQLERVQVRLHIFF